jgi:hypothetical protein
MPYYVFRLYEDPVRRVEVLAEFERYPEASRFAKARRAAAGPGGGAVRIVFGAHALEAEEALMNPRPAPPRIGDDY